LRKKFFHRSIDRSYSGRFACSLVAVVLCKLVQETMKLVQACSCSSSSVLLLLSLSTLSTTHAFSSALFQEIPALQARTPSQTKGVDIELPDFKELFERIQQVSPLAGLVINGGDVAGARGFAGIQDTGKHHVLTLVCDVITTNLVKNLADTFCSVCMCMLYSYHCRCVWPEMEDSRVQQTKMCAPD
jgi:hypothetical protein